MATKKKEKTPDNGSDGPNGPTKITQSGKITDVLSNDSVSEANVGCSESSDTSDTSGNYTIQYTQGTTPEIKITHNSHVERNTYPDYGPDYSIIPNSFNLEEFNRICREAYSGTVRWPLEPENKPIVYITTDDGPPKYVEDYIVNILNKDIGKITKNVFSDLSITKGPRGEAPNTGVIIYDYKRSRIGDYTAEDHDNNNIIYWAEIRLGGSNADGSEHIIKRTTIMHETGHAIGFQGHATTTDSIMYPSAALSPAHPGQIDIDNGTVLYSRPAKNTSPDNDPKPTGGSSYVLMQRVQPFIDSFFVRPGARLYRTRDNAVEKRRSAEDSLSPASRFAQRVASRLSAGNMTKPSIGDLITMLPISLQKKFGSVTVGADLADSGLIYADLGDENKSITTLVQNIGFSSPESITTARFRDGNFVGSLDMLLAKNIGLYRAGMAKYGEDISVGVFDTYDQKNGVNMFNIALGAFPTGTISGNFFRNHKFLFNYRGISDNNMITQFIDANVNLGRFMVGGSYGTVKSKNPISQVALNASANLGNIILSGSYGRVLSNTNNTEFTVDAYGNIGKVMLSGAYRYFNMGNTNWSSATGALSTKVGPGRLLLNFLYEPGRKDLGFKYVLVLNLDKR